MLLTLATFCTIASHYGVGDGYHGQTAADGSVYNAYAHTAAHKTLPFGSMVRVTNTANNKSVVVKITDRGPFIPGRGLDLSYGAFSVIADPAAGVVDVCASRLI